MTAFQTPPTFVSGQFLQAAQLGLLSANETFLRAKLFDSGELGASQSKIDSGFLSQDYSHLLLVASIRGDSGASSNNMTLNLNGDTTTSYSTSYIGLNGNGAIKAGSSSLGASQVATYPGGATLAGVFGSLIVYVGNYTNKTAWKPVIGFWGYTRGNPPSTVDDVLSGTTFNLYHFVGTISALTITPGGSPNFVAGSRMTVYGLY